MNYIKIFWIIAVVLFIIPFLGLPQSFKDFIIILIAIAIGFLAWMRQRIIFYKRSKYKEIIENKNDKE
jgi:NADH:ubiquinone oxidoreductase subunit K